MHSTTYCIIRIDCTRLGGAEMMHLYRTGVFTEDQFSILLLLELRLTSRCVCPNPQLYIRVYAGKPKLFNRTDEMWTRSPPSQWISIIVWTEHNNGDDLNNNDENDTRAPQTVNALVNSWTHSSSGYPCTLIVNYRGYLYRIPGTSGRRRSYPKPVHVRAFDTI